MRHSTFIKNTTKQKEIKTQQHIKLRGVKLHHLVSVKERMNLVKAGISSLFMAAETAAEEKGWAQIKNHNGAEETHYEPLRRAGTIP